MHVKSAKKLVAGKRTAWIIADCECGYVCLYRPTKDERATILASVGIFLWANAARTPEEAA